LPISITNDRRSIISHTVTIKTEIRDAAAVRAACDRLRLPAPVLGKAQLFDREVEGLAVQLPDWRHPVVANLATGELAYDNYGGYWGDQKELDHLLQAYAVEKCRIEARKKGHLVTEQPLADGSIKVTVQVGVA
jgi:hypothetical protein